MLTVDDLPPGPFRTSELLAGGTSRRALETARRDGVVRRVLRGVMVRSDEPDSIELRARAAALVTGPHVVLVDRTAAWLHGLDVLGWHEKEVLPPLETFALRGHHRPERQGLCGGVRDLRPEDTMRVGGVVVTTPLRTALDLACLLPERSGLAALDQFLHRGDFLRVDLVRLLPRYVRRRGVVQARWLVEHADGRAESPAESWTRYELLRHGLPAPTPQHWVQVRGVKTYRVDLAYVLHRVIVEYDGIEFHSSPADQARDRRRRKHLRDLGWIVIVLDRDSFVGDAPDAWVRGVRDALRSRSAVTPRAQGRNWRLIGAEPASRRSRARVSTVQDPPLNETGGASARCP